MSYSTSKIFGILLLMATLWACGSSSSEEVNTAAPEKNAVKLFKLLSAQHTGIDFTNDLVENEYHNIDVYEYLYNGAGVAAGDVNNDGLADLFFTGNMVHNKLYLNKGNLKFEDITEQAGLVLNDGWCTGVTMGDVNGDGFLDIYVARSYYKDEKLRENLLYINNGDLSFTERGAEYGVNDNSFSTHGSFFDYDLDGDLDLYVINHPVDFGPPSDLKYAKLHLPPDMERDKLYRNDGDKFTEVGRQAGISEYGFGLSATVADLNQDGWPDIYVANDYAEPDVLYQNNGDGTFTNVIGTAMKHLSFYGMGADIADINNDGLLDVVVMDMLAADNYRQKTNMRSMAPDQFWDLVGKGYHHQYMKNTLQLNNGNGSFSEIGQLAGITKTDWSWATLFADFDNDGDKDLFTANGYRRDARNIDNRLDFDKRMAASGGSLDPKERFDFVMSIPTQKLSNYLFMNQDGYQFEELSNESGISDPSFSNGATYADLDADGDLDLVVSNVLSHAFVYENQADQQAADHHWLRIALKGDRANTYGLGTQLKIKTADGELFQEMTLSRGFQSSVEPIIHFGLGAVDKIESLLITWPDGRHQTINDPGVDQLLVIHQKEAVEKKPKQETPEAYFAELAAVDFKHMENKHRDFDKEILLPHRMSQFGPAIAVGDIDQDGRDDFYVGGAKDQAGKVYKQVSDGTFKGVSTPLITGDKASEDVAAEFFDADGDGDLDLFVVSGGSEFAADDPLLFDRLYINHGGSFSKKAELPQVFSSGGCVSPGDYDNDGDIDLFVGGRVDPGKYPLPGVSYLLTNTDNGFEETTAEIMPEVSDIGMVSAALWSDHNGDGQLDLILAGEWMPITIFKQDQNKFMNVTAESGIGISTGWWNSLAEEDLDGDGDPDYIAGNLGLNYKFHGTPKEPLHVYAHDFDNTGSIDIVLGYYNDGTCYPVRGRQCSSQQMPNIAEKFPTYHDFGQASLFDVYGDRLNEALHYQATEFASSVVINQGGGKFEMKQLPTQAQFSAVFGIIPEDFNADGHVDLLIAGNFYVSEVETGRADAGTGLYLQGDGTGNFKPVPIVESGFFANGDVRGLRLINNSDGSKFIIVANNNDRLKIFKANKASIQ